MTGIGTQNGSVGWKIFKESAGLGIAEIVSIGVSLGVVGVADQVAPDLLKSTSKAIGKTLIEPILDPFEWTMGKLCKLEDCQVDKTKAREERAEAIAKTLTVFGAAWVAAMVSKIATRKITNNMMGMQTPVAKTGSKLQDFLNEYIIPNAHDVKVAKWDEVIHYGSILLLNTVGAKQTDGMIRSTTNVLQKLGVPETKAKELANMAIIWELPNLLGFGAGVGAIAHTHLNESGYLKKITQMGPTSHVNELARERDAGAGKHSVA